MLLSARETAELLDIKVDTLYAYVSRGLLNSIEIADSRERHYDAEDVERFRAGRGGRGAHVRPEALMPVIGSAICLIENHRFYYRGHDALVLAGTATLEDVAAILWEEDASQPVATPTLTLPRSRGREPFVRTESPPPSPASGGGSGWRSGEGQLAAIERCQIRLAEL